MIARQDMSQRKKANNKNQESSEVPATLIDIGKMLEQRKSVSMHRMIESFIAAYQQELKSKISEINEIAVQESSLKCYQRQSVVYALNLLDRQNVKNINVKLLKNIFMAYVNELQISHMTAARDVLRDFQLPRVELPAAFFVNADKLLDVPLADDEHRRRSPRNKASFSDPMDSEAEPQAGSSKKVEAFQGLSSLAQALRQAELELSAAGSHTAEFKPLGQTPQQQMAILKMQLDHLKSIVRGEEHYPHGMSKKVVETNAVLETEGKAELSPSVEWNKMLPITSLDGLTALNGQLEHDKKIQEMALYLSKGAPNTGITDAVAHIASLLFDHVFQLQLNMRGSYQNFPVKKIKLLEYPNIMKLVQVSVGFTDVGKTTTEKSVNSALARWLRYAGDRQGGCSKR